MNNTEIKIFDIKNKTTIDQPCDITSHKVLTLDQDNFKYIDISNYCIHDFIFYIKQDKKFCKEIISFYQVMLDFCLLKNEDLNLTNFVDVFNFNFFSQEIQSIYINQPEKHNDIIFILDKLKPLCKLDYTISNNNVNFVFNLSFFEMWCYYTQEFIEIFNTFSLNHKHHINDFDDFDFVIYNFNYKDLYFNFLSFFFNEH